MATKANPGKYDCYGAAENDEPLFVLLARDPIAPDLVRAWAALRAGDSALAKSCMEDAEASLCESKKQPVPWDGEKSIEARACADDMRRWRKAHRSG